MPGWFAWPDVVKACERVLSGVVADRAILDHCASLFDRHEPSGHQYYAEEFAEQILRAMAQRFADRPGWREEWAA